ncbi:putative tetratricopeptide-like helical domain superfamily [Dioscorea sansibarensis]
MQRCLVLSRDFTSLPAAGVFLKSFSSLHLHRLLDEFPHRVSSDPIATIQERLCSREPLDPTLVAMAFKVYRGKTGSQVHKLAFSVGLDSFLFVSNSLMNMYSKSESFDLARKVFDDIPEPDVVSWNTVMSGFTHGCDALDFVMQMHRTGILFDAVTLAKLLPSLQTFRISSLASSCML